MPYNIIYADLMVEFTLSHLSKNFKVDLYRYSLDHARKLSRK